jgi:hypothetical protein
MRIVGGGCERSNSSYTPSTVFSADRQCWGGGGWVRVRGMGYHPPTPQAGRVTDSDRRGRVREGWGEGGMKHSNSDNKCCRRMRGIKLSAVGDCAK